MPHRQVTRTHQLCRRLEAGLPPNPLTTRLRDGVASWQAALLAVAALRNSDLRERHWADISGALGRPLHDREALTLAGALQLGVRGRARHEARRHRCWGWQRGLCRC
jgi:hypothetical protein